MMNAINFTFETEFGTFSDTVILSEQEVEAIKQADADTRNQLLSAIDEIKQTRLNNWLSIVNPPVTDQQSLPDSGT